MWYLFINLPIFPIAEYFWVHAVLSLFNLNYLLLGVFNYFYLVYVGCDFLFIIGWRYAKKVTLITYIWFGFINAYTCADFINIFFSYFILRISPGPIETPLLIETINNSPDPEARIQDLRNYSVSIIYPAPPPHLCQIVMHSNTTLYVCVCTF